ncbi:MAG: hypothetical protein ABFC71_07145 [Methanoregula sp.]
MLKINLSKLIGIIIGLSLVFACSAVAAADTSQGSNALISPETIGTGLVKENIQNFTGTPNEEIAYRGTKELPSGKVYEVTTKTGRFTINAKTGEIESAIIRDGILSSSITAKDIPGMEMQAKAFAQKNYRDFNSKNMVLTESRILDHGDAGREYLFVWNEMAGEAYTQSAVMVSVLPDWDNSIAYIGIDRPLLVDTTPKVSQNVAQETALRTFAMGSAAKIQSKLVVVPDRDNQKLAWMVETIETNNDNTSHGGTVIVDAVLGNVLSVYPLQ